MSSDLSVKEIARDLGFQPAVVYEMINTGELTAQRYKNGRIRVRSEDYEALKKQATIVNHVNDDK